MWRRARKAGEAEQRRGVKQLSPALAASTVPSAVRWGPFERIGETYQAQAAWVHTNGYTFAPEEVNLADPVETKPKDLLTEVRFPVRRP